MFHVFFFPNVFPRTLPCFLSVCFSLACHSAGMDASPTSSPPCHLYPSLSPCLSLPPPTPHLPPKRWVVFPETQVQSNQRGAGPRSQRHDFNVIHALCLLVPLPAHPLYSPPSSPDHSISLTLWSRFFNSPTVPPFLKTSCYLCYSARSMAAVTVTAPLERSLSFSSLVVCGMFMPLHSLWQRLWMCASFLSCYK